jgi:hypothetical protein
LLILFLAMLLQGRSASCQTAGDGTEAGDSARIPGRRMQQQKEFGNHTYPYSAKLRNRWELGVKGGLPFAGSDVRYWGPTGGWGVHVRKALGYIFSLRVEYDWLRMKGLNWQPSQAWQKNSVLAQYYAPGEYVFYNYRSTVHELSLQGVASLNNIGFHRRSSRLNVYVFGGIAASTYSTFYKVLDKNGKPYDYSGIMTQFADKYSAKAILSRVYLNMLDYPNAAAQADDVIASGYFKLADSYDKAFNNSVNSTEDIFAIQQTSQSNVGTSNQGLTTFYAPNQGLPPGQTAGRGDAQVDSGYFAYFDAGDFRATYITNGLSIAGEPGNYPNKWQQFYKAIPVVRLAEMYLTRGEANLLSGGSVGGANPVDDINVVRARSGADSLSSVTAQDFVDERFRELGFEGDRYWTLKRFKMDIDGLGYDDNKMILPIPQSEIDVNTNLKQNAGY